jgi:hypothetical protein
MERTGYREQISLHEELKQPNSNTRMTDVSNEACREDMAMTPNDKVEKFAASELTSLRNELMQSGIDAWQAAEVLSAFLAGRGYGVIPEQARDAVLRMENAGCSHECMQMELERLALVM